MPTQLNPSNVHAILICDFVPFSHSFWRGYMSWEGFMPFFILLQFMQFHYRKYTRSTLISIYVSCSSSSYGRYATFGKHMQTWSVKFHELSFRWISCCTFLYPKTVCTDWKKCSAFSQNLFPSSTYYIPLLHLLYFCVYDTVAISSNV